MLILRIDPDDIQRLPHILRCLILEVHLVPQSLRKMSERWITSSPNICNVLEIQRLLALEGCAEDSSSESDTSSSEESIPDIRDNVPVVLAQLADMLELLLHELPTNVNDPDSVSTSMYDATLEAVDDTIVSGNYFVLFVSPYLRSVEQSHKFHMRFCFWILFPSHLFLD